MLHVFIFYLLVHTSIQPWGEKMRFNKIFLLLKCDYGSSKLEKGMTAQSKERASYRKQWEIDPLDDVVIELLLRLLELISQHFLVVFRSCGNLLWTTIHLHDLESARKWKIKNYISNFEASFSKVKLMRFLE